MSRQGCRCGRFAALAARLAEWRGWISEVAAFVSRGWYSYFLQTLESATLAIHLLYAVVLIRDSPISPALVEEYYTLLLVIAVQCVCVVPCPLVCTATLVLAACPYTIWPSFRYFSRVPNDMFCGAS